MWYRSVVLEDLPVGAGTCTAAYMYCNTVVTDLSNTHVLQHAGYIHHADMYTYILSSGWIFWIVGCEDVRTDTHEQLALDGVSQSGVLIQNGNGITPSFQSTRANELC